MREWLDEVRWYEKRKEVVEGAEEEEVGSLRERDGELELQNRVVVFESDRLQFQKLERPGERVVESRKIVEVSLDRG